MMGNVTHRGKGSFTHVENTVFFDHALSLKAKGIYCQIRSLENNPEWVFTIRGFTTLVRDGVDAVTAGIKELEAAGYIIRARKRSGNGRFVTAEEATWVTLDDPAMRAEVAAELKADGFAVLSEFSREPPANVESEPEAPEEGECADGPEKAQIVARTGKSVSGKATSGKPAPINYSSDKGPHDDKKPPSCPPEGGAPDGGAGFVPYRKGEFPEAFERLCAMSIKPVASLRFKRDCLAAWERRVAEGFSPGQIVDAYAAYAKSYWLRNGDDPALAKNLARWIEGEGGLSAYSDEPIPPDLLDVDGGPLDMVGLAQADPEFAKLWRRVETRRAVVRSQLYAVDRGTPETEVMKACEKDAHYARYLQACQERYDRYLKVLNLFRGPSAGFEETREAVVAKGPNPYGRRVMA
ncbi:hypothetical protein [Gordonibacter sp. RACS_AR49]|uniref:hypothetical protein n=1 Tax=Gordonibacter sp. RACS_AR49 TaxID=2871986 RepID=UPI00262C37F7|nr:hypothetical protein [Gordonibacter sp. RACS_AR49]MDN4508618.1 helix-turn-helix domain-containing protein [Gordonibacter sp. RACS_AR49]